MTLMGPAVACLASYVNHGGERGLVGRPAFWMAGKGTDVRVFAGNAYEMGIPSSVSFIYKLLFSSLK